LQSSNGAPMAPIPQHPADPSQGVQPMPTAQASPPAVVPPNPPMQSQQGGGISGGESANSAGAPTTAETPNEPVQTDSNPGVGNPPPPAGQHGASGPSEDPPAQVVPNSQGLGAGNGAATVTMTVTMTVTAPCEGATGVGSGSGGSSGGAGGSGVQANERIPAAQDATFTGPPRVDPTSASGSSGPVGVMPPKADRQAYGVPEAMKGGKHLNLIRDHKIRALHKGKRSW
jgi:hypothetical protein